MVVEQPYMGYALAGKAKKKKGKFLPGLTDKKLLAKNARKAGRAALAVKTFGLSEVAIRNNASLRKKFDVKPETGKVLPGLFNAKTARIALGVKTLGLSEIAIRNNPELRKQFKAGKKEGEILPGLFKPELLARNIRKAGVVAGGALKRRIASNVPEPIEPEVPEMEEAENEVPAQKPGIDMKKLLPLASLALPFLLGE